MSSYCKVVIIDDEFIMRQGMKHMLDWEEEGFQIVGEATNGKEGLELAERLRPDIILADIVMPVLDGIEFSRILKSRFPEIQLIILSSYDKFEYVKETLMNGAADYILKPALNPDILLKTLRRVAEKIPGMQIKKMKHTSCSAQIEKYLLGYQAELDRSVFAEVFPHTVYRIAGVNLKELCGGQKDGMAQAERIQTEYFSGQKEYVSVPVFMEEELLCFVFNYRIKDEEKLAGDIRECVEKMGAEYPGVFQVVSSAFSALRELKEHYKEEVRPFVNRKFYYEGRRVLFVEGKEEKIREERFPFEEYSAALLHRQFSRAIDMIESYAEYMCEIRMEEERMKNITKNLLYNYLMEIEQYDIPSEELKRDWFSRVDSAEFLSAYRTELAGIVGELREIRDRRLESEDLRLMEIKTYISTHYAEELELADIAEKFGFNYYYLSAWFNRQSREGFSEYLNKIRIEKACRMLREEPDLPIAEVGMRTGYPDQSYFSRVFKKVAKMTPSAYRKASLEGRKL